MAEDACPDCGGDLKFLEKDTSSGREYREYRCLKCGKLVTLGGDVALWQILHDANQEREDRLRSGGTASVQKPVEPANRLSGGKRWWQFWLK